MTSWAWTGLLPNMVLAGRAAHSAFGGDAPLRRGRTETFSAWRIETNICRPANRYDPFRVSAAFLCSKVLNFWGLAWKRSGGVFVDQSGSWRARHARYVEVIFSFGGTFCCMRVEQWGFHVVRCFSDQQN